MDDLYIWTEHLPSVFFSHKIIKDRKVASEISCLQSVSFDTMIMSIKYVVLNENDVHDRRVSYLMNINGNQLKNHSDNRKVATRKCFKQLIDL